MNYDLWWPPHTCMCSASDREDIHAFEMGCVHALLYVSGSYRTVSIVVATEELSRRGHEWPFLPAA